MRETHLVMLQANCKIICVFIMINANKNFKLQRVLWPEMSSRAESASWEEK